MDMTNCFQCGNFFNTFDNFMPYGCRIFGFQSQRNPSSVVKEALKHDCHMFVQKPKPVHDQPDDQKNMDSDHNIDIKV
ncbi:MAG: hypothetical protein ABSG94_12995 [Brevinematales bacterium]|jgi:hypothetical protein